jgi:hypothetical protein
MFNLRFLSIILAICFALPLGTLYRQNIEVWASEHGLDRLLAGGAKLMLEQGLSSFVLFGFFFCLGGAAFLWGEYFLRRPKKSQLTGKPVAVDGQTYRGEDVQIDGRSFQRCSFVSCRLRFMGEKPFQFQHCSFYDETEIIIDTDSGSASVALAEFSRQNDITFRIQPVSSLSLISSSKDKLR